MDLGYPKNVERENEVLQKAIDLSMHYPENLTNYNVSL